MVSLLVLRLLLPYAALWGINWALDHKLGVYKGHVQDLDIHLYRGAYVLKDLEIKKSKSSLPPILKVGDIDLSISWRAMLRKEISADILIQEMVLRLFDSQEKDKKQLGTGESGWKDTLNVIIPLKVESLKVENSALYFNNYDLVKAQPVQLEQVTLIAIGLRNRPANSADALSDFSAEAYLQGSARLQVNGQLDILADEPRACFSFSLVQLHLPTINQVLLAYVPLNIAEGDLRIYGETAISHGEVKGYTNVFLNNIQALESKQKYISFKHFAYEIAFAFTNWVLKNRPEKSLAAHIPFQRHEGHFDINSSAAFWSAVKNRTKEIPPGFDHSITLKQIEPQKN